MTSLATVVGLLPMALKLETGSEAYAPLARVIIGGLIASVALTIFVVPAAYLLIYRGRAEVPRRQRDRRKLDEIPQICYFLAVKPEHSSCLIQQRPEPQNLTLHQAEQIAIQNHPQIQAAINLASAAEAQVYASALGLLSDGLRQPYGSQGGNQQPDRGPER